ncbi:hypothetical protein Pmar_PMAR011259 [Perkinsus marinus ATCC 50983]|uniref:Vacuolar protein sorting-associated protein 13 VPS13 adaptor binding domain-containing protein n=1 Tax=Perkinsus marinus (strain ATCC 50983 / TXsc) TaxID=423536 RepID=C5LRH7_PERM5|nr:hypothetical protein Pmar_PMAR011259 [Perkinsus marinus ATCC 50983]EER00664.1 hypothetical protein Pmar_PMAR011259 [Perkinsus marinus ATCC 50983]|eukprot:XP_002767946.1 hypothetical protein Pmar_PMAR011259 [Perkinsus marinus ATCC 50983]
MAKVHHMYTKLTFGIKALSITNGPDNDLLLSDTTEELVDITVFVSDKRIAIEEKGKHPKMLFNFRLGAIKVFFRPRLWRALDSPSATALDLEPDQQTSFKWWQVDLPKMLQVKLKDAGWGWSGHLAVDRVVGDAVCQVFQETEGMFMNIRVDVRPYRSCVFIVFGAEDYTIASYSLRNNSDNSMWVRQAHTRAYFIPLLRHSSTPFAWYEPTKPKKLEILLDPASKRSTIVDFIPEQSNSQASAARASAQSGGPSAPAFEHSGVLVAPLRGRSQRLQYKVTSSGPTKVFILYNE